LEQHIPLKPSYIPTRLHGVTAQKTTHISIPFFIFIWEIGVSYMHPFTSLIHLCIHHTVTPLGSLQSHWQSVEIVCTQECNLPNIMEPQYKVHMVTDYPNKTV
jgi:hypothetical protein